MSTIEICKENCSSDNDSTIIGVRKSPKEEFCNNYDPGCELIMCEPCHQGKIKDSSSPNTAN